MFIFVALGITSQLLHGASVNAIKDQSTGWTIYELKADSTRVLIAPDAGANAFSIQIEGVEQFRQPESLNKLPGAGFGNPILYPTPNRVRNAVFRFRGKDYKFKANARKNFIHGLVNRVAWKVVDQTSNEHSAQITFEASFESGSELYRLFPFSHALHVTIQVSSGTVRWTYKVQSTGKQPVPFGFALHPYFLYQGERAKTFLTIPATHMMQSKDRLPTGKLLAPSELDFPLSKPMSLADTNFDDVFFGMTSKKETMIDFRGTSKQIEIAASDDFTHLVVWTPDRSYFGIESQTCSTDAHNMHDKGFKRESHLQICPPGESMSGSVEYRFRSSAGH